jgi:hypothetical protein
MQRRTFILLTSIGGAATAFTGLHCNPRGPAGSAILEKPGVLSYICDEKTLREIGLAYRQLRPEENEAGKLEELLLTDSGGRGLSASVDDQFIQALISKKIEEDFEKADTVVVKGWILAITEARQCALFAVHHQ